jgi:hypothetical protein
VNEIESFLMVNAKWTFGFLVFIDISTEKFIIPIHNGDFHR